MKNFLRAVKESEGLKRRRHPNHKQPRKSVIAQEFIDRAEESKLSRIRSHSMESLNSSSQMSKTLTQMMTRSPPSSPLQEADAAESPLDRSFDLSATNPSMLRLNNTPKPSPKTGLLFPRFGNNSPPLSGTTESEIASFVCSSSIPHLELAERKQQLTPTMGPTTSESGMLQSSKLSAIIENDNPKQNWDGEGTPSPPARICKSKSMENVEAIIQVIKSKDFSNGNVYVV